MSLSREQIADSLKFEQSPIARRAGAPLRGTPLILWRFAVTGAALVLLLFAWHDAFWIAMNSNMHVQPFSIAVYTGHHRLQALVRIAMLVFAILTAWRTRCDLNARLLTEALIGGSADIYWQWWGRQTAQTWVLLPMLLKYAGTSFGLMRFIQFAANFGTGDYKGIRAALYRFAPLALLLAAFGVASPLLKLPPHLNPLPGYDSTWASASDINHLHSLYLLGDALAKLAMIVAAYIGWKTSPSEERGRTRLVLISFVSYGLGTAIHFIGSVFVGEANWLNWIDAVATLVLPIGLVTAIFRKQFFDVQLFLDRAVGGAIVATILLAIAHEMDDRGNTFAHNVGAWVNGLFVNSSLPPGIMETIVGLGLGLLFFATIHKTHAFLEKAVHRTIFPGREGRMHKLREFQGELIGFNDLDKLRRRVVEVVHDLAKAAFTNVFVNEGDQYIPVIWSEKQRPHAVSAHIPEIASLQAGQWVQLDDKPSEIAGVLAFPMIIAGKLYGFLALGQSRVQARYDSDEIRELGAIARETGVILFALRERAFEDV